MFARRPYGVNRDTETWPTEKKTPPREITHAAAFLEKRLT
jgi:hypothetical protein